MHKKIFAACFILLCGFVFFASAGAFHENRTNIFAVDSKEAAIEEVFPCRDAVREIYGASNWLLSPNAVPKNSRYIYVKEDDGFLHTIGLSSFDMEMAKRRLSQLNQACQDSGADFVYVSYPSKNEQDDAATYGIDTNDLEYREELLAYADSSGLNYLDVKPLFEADGYTLKDIFYKTDHHWKAPAGLYSARAIANYLNDTLGYSLSTDLLAEDQFTFTTYEDLWFGETGRDLSLGYVDALDDFTEIRPAYDTSLQIDFASGDSVAGDFSIMMNDFPHSSAEIDLYEYSAHYAYDRNISSPTHYHNNNVEGPKILLIKDSFSVVVIPFLTLATSDLTVWDVRDVQENVTDYIRQNDFDIVLLAYTDFWATYMWDFH